MKFLLGTFCVGVLSLVFGWMLPWWSIAIAGGIAGFALGENGWQSFLFALLGAGLTWFILCAMINSNNEGLLAEKIGVLFNGISPIMLMLVSALIGSLVASLGAVSGYHLRKLFVPASFQE